MILQTIRLILIALLVGYVGLIGTLICLLRPFHPDNARLFGRILGRPGMWILGIKFLPTNLDGLAKHHPCIIISNHQHNLDIFPCAAVIPKRTVSLGKKSIRKIPLFGTFYWLSGNVLIDRSHKRKAYETMDKAVEAITQKDTTIWMMPEGTRNTGADVAPFKKGVFYAAIKAQCPIIPVSFSRYSHDINLKKLRSGEIRMVVHPPVETRGMTIDDIENLALHCHQIISQGRQKLS